MVLRRSPLELDAAEVSASIGPVLSRWPVRRAWLFGSVARGEQWAGSDVDIMVELDEGASLGFAFLTMEDEVADCLGCAADLVTIVRSRSTRAFLEEFDRDKVMVYERTGRR